MAGGGSTGASVGCLLIPLCGFPRRLSSMVTQVCWLPTAPQQIISNLVTSAACIYLPVPVGQESGHRFAGSSGSRKAAIQVLPGLHLHLETHLGPKYWAECTSLCCKPARPGGGVYPLVWPSLKRPPDTVSSGCSNSHATPHPPPPQAKHTDFLSVRLCFAYQDTAAERAAHEEPSGRKLRT